MRQKNSGQRDLDITLMEAAVEKNRMSPELLVETRAAAARVEESLPSGLRAFWYRVTHWETWDWRIKYVLIAPAWLWLCLRARSCWFFTAANPTLTFGGFDGESKREMYSQLPPGSFPRSVYVAPSTPFDDLVNVINNAHFSYPVAVKPDAGKMGFMFRRINSADELKTYHQKINCNYIVQEWVSLPLEVSVFYYRFPHAEHGRITGFVRKDFLEVTGDGRSTLAELISRYPRAQFRLAEMRSKHKDKLQCVLASDEKYCLSPALNLSRGGRLVSLEHEKDERLLKVFDDLSHYTGKFYFGRYDIKCSSIEELKQGKNFSILEYNGSGAEPHHVYGNGNSLWKACRILIDHWCILYRISRANHRSGTAYWDFGRGWRFLRQAGKHLKKLKELDAQTAHK